MLPEHKFIKKIDNLGHDEMILSLAAAQAPIFDTPLQTFCDKSACLTFFVSFINLYVQTVLETFYLILLHLSI